MPRSSSVPRHRHDKLRIGSKRACLSEKIFMTFMDHLEQEEKDVVVMFTESVGYTFGATVKAAFDLIRADCPSLTSPAQGAPPDPALLQACIHQMGVHVVTTYQPAERYWLFQGIEAGIFAVLAIGLLALSIWWVQRRVS